MMKTRFSAPELDELAHNWILTDKIKLPPAASIVVAGAYQGKLLRLLAELFPDHGLMAGYEPQAWAAEKAVEATVHIKWCHVYSFGLLAGPGEASLPMGEFQTDACSVLCEDRVMGLGRFKDANEQLIYRGHIDLFVLNVEGYEYKLLPYLRGQATIDRIDRLAVQFHTKYADFDAGLTLATYDSIYRRTVDVFPHWVLWERR